MEMISCVALSAGMSGKAALFIYKAILFAVEDKASIFEKSACHYHISNQATRTYMDVRAFYLSVVDSDCGKQS